MKQDIALMLLVNLAKRCRSNKRGWKNICLQLGEDHPWAQHCEGEYYESFNSLHAGKVIYYGAQNESQ